MTPAAPRVIAGLLLQLSAAAALLLPLTIASSPACAQVLQPGMSSRHYDFNIGPLNGISVHGEARGATMLDYQPAVIATVANGRATLHRLFLDRTHHLFFGYDLITQYVPGHARVFLRFSPLTDLSGFQHINLEGFSPGGKAVPFTSKTVRLGGPLSLPVEVDAANATILEDTLTFTPSNR